VRHHVQRSRIVGLVVVAAVLSACSSAPRAAGEDARIAPSGTEAAARIATTPRHAEWVTIGAGTPDSLRAWVVYPERSTKAPVVVVVHEIFGYTDWVSGVADQLAASGFIAIAPDFLTGKVPAGAADSVKRRVNSQLDPATVVRQVAAAGAYGIRLPAAQPKWGVVGFCWGGTVSFNTAVASPAGLGASVVYYGSSPRADRLATVAVPVLGLYGGDDARVNATVPPADSAMKALGKSFTHRTYEGAGHGFLRQQDGREGANLRAAQQAWPATIEFFRRHLGT
jgi:carboxymethylenebutenolidase